MVVDILFIAFLSLGQSESAVIHEAVELPYACVPAAGAVVLRRFGISANYADLYQEMEVRPDGTASLGALRRTCEGHGLFVGVYQYLTIPQLRTYLSHGYCAVVISKTETAEQHATCYFGDPPLECDLLHPVRFADPDILSQQLESGVHAIIIGKRAVPPPLIDLTSFLAVAASTAVLVYLTGVMVAKWRNRSSSLKSA